MILHIQGKEVIIRRILIDLAIYSTILDILIFLGTLLSVIFKINIEKILLPINIIITIVVSIIIFLWFYVKISNVYSNLEFFIRKNFEIKSISFYRFVKGRFIKTRKIYLRFFSFKFSIVM